MLLAGTLIGVAAAGQIPSGRHAATTTPARPSGPPSATTAGIPGDGVFVVGTQIAPGRYETSGGGTTCHWARLRNAAGRAGWAITNGTTTGRTTVTVRKSDVVFETAGCNPWTRKPPSQS